MPYHNKVVDYFGRTIILALLILIFSLLPSPLKIFSILLLPVIFINLWPSIQNGSILLQYFFYFIVNLSLLTVVGIIFWIFDTKITIFTGSLSVIIFILVTHLVIFRTKNKSKMRQKLIDRDDIYSIIIALLICGSLLVTTFSGGFRIGLLKDATHGFDNAQHTSLTYSLYENQGYVYGSSEDTTQKLVYSDRGEYPKASHLVTSYFWRALSGNLSFQKNAQMIMAYYYFGKLILLLLTLFLSSRLLLLISSKRNISNNFYDFLIVLALTFFSTIIYHLTNLAYGFAPFMFTVLLTTFTVFHLQNRTSYKSDVIIGAIILTSSTFSWLLSVIYFGLYLAYLIFNKDNRNKSKLIDFAKTNVTAYTLAFFIVSLSFLQLYFQFKYSVKPGNINEDGGIAGISNLFVIICILTASAIYYLTKQYSLLIKFSYLMCSAALLSGLIYLYQVVTIDKTAYFYTKSLGILLCIVLVLFASAAHQTVNIIKNYSNVFIATVIFGGFMIMITSLTQINPAASVKYYFGLRSMSTATAQTISEHLEDIANSKPLVIINKNQNSEEDVLGTIYLNMITREHEGCRSKIISHQIFNRQNPEKLQEIISGCKQDYGILYISN